MTVKITKKMTIAEIFELAPDSVVIMQNAGLKCTGCDARTDRTLEKLMQDHHLEEEKVIKILGHLNRIKQIGDTMKKPQEEDFILKEIKEGNKTYYKLAGMVFSENAYKRLQEYASKKGLRLRLDTGGCSGFKYNYDYYDQPEKDEKTYPLSDKLSLYMNNFTFDKSYGSVVDFPIGLHASGLQIINPNKKRSCSCGTSVGF